MSLVLDFRTSEIAGDVRDPVLYDVTNFAAVELQYRIVPRWEWDSAIRGKRVVIGTHGFNVHRDRGVRSLTEFGNALGLGPRDLYVSLVWPGDWWVPAVNYPFAGQPAMDSGRRLAMWCSDRLATAQDVTFVSHSLGARLILEAISKLPVSNRPRVSLVCLMAGAINADCLVREYASVVPKVNMIRVLASHDDDVLALAYPIGDLASNAIHPDHAQGTAALGHNGPADPVPVNLPGPWQIHDPGYGHSSYLPPGNSGPPGTDWRNAADFVSRVRANIGLVWPI